MSAFWRSAGTRTHLCLNRHVWTRLQSPAQDTSIYHSNPPGRPSVPPAACRVGSGAHARQGRSCACYPVLCHQEIQAGQGGRGHHVYGHFAVGHPRDRAESRAQLCAGVSVCARFGSGLRQVRQERKGRDTSEWQAETRDSLGRSALRRVSSWRIGDSHLVCEEDFGRGAFLASLSACSKASMPERGCAERGHSGR